MTGLEKITNQITQEAKQSAAEDLAEANKKVGIIIESAKKEAKREAEKIIEKAKLSSVRIEDRAISSAQFNKRNRILKFKQDYIENLIEDTKNALADSDDDKYFSTLLDLFKIHSREEDTVISFNKKDLLRLPSNFADKASEIIGHKVSIHAGPCDIKAGFILLYNGIDINCSFDKIFESLIDDLRDAAGKILFPVKKESS